MSQELRHAPVNDLTSGEHNGWDAAFAMYGQAFELTAAPSRPTSRT